MPTEASNKANPSNDPSSNVENRGCAIELSANVVRVATFAIGRSGSTEFRASWKNGALTTQRKHHRLNGFFAFCIENEWLTRNPSKRMKAVHANLVPTDYFTPAELKRIIDGTYAYGDWKGGRDFEHRALRLRALIPLMRWSRLSILDAVTLERQRLQGHRLLLYRHKTKVPVFVPLPLDVATSLHDLPIRYWASCSTPCCVANRSSAYLRLLATRPCQSHTGFKLLLPGFYERRVMLLGHLVRIGRTAWGLSNGTEFDPELGRKVKFLIAQTRDLPEDRLYAKEQRLVEEIKSELAEGRRCQVFDA